jgi:hypothetical protein
LSDDAKNTTLKDQLKHGLDETLILITGTEFFVGFQYSVVFHKSFEALPLEVRYLHIFGMVLLLVTLLLAMSPVPFHRITEGGHSTFRLSHYVHRVVMLALLPFAIGLGIGVYIVTLKVIGATWGVVIGVLAAVAALIAWYGIGFLQWQAKGRPHMKTDAHDMNQKAGTSVAEKVDHVLTEARVVLPGAQALIGFQFVSVFSDGFDSLSQEAKVAHLVSMGFIVLSNVLLMTPAAYHRIVERGEDTEQFHHLAGMFVLGAMVTLAFSIAINFYIVVGKITASQSLAVIGAAVVLTAFLGFWFGYTWYRRWRRQ